MIAHIERFVRDTRGALAVEVGLLIGIFVLLVGGGVEMAIAFQQKNDALQSARVGGRLAATQAPVAQGILQIGLPGGGLQPGQPMPDYDITCSGASQSCTQGAYDADAMAVLLYGPNGQSCTTNAARRAQGMCNHADINTSNIEVRYRSSGLGTVGAPPEPLPLITVRVVDVVHDWVFLESLLGDSSTFDPVEVTVMGEATTG